jgi:hypothetical protein
VPVHCVLLHVQPCTACLNANSPITPPRQQKKGAAGGRVQADSLLLQLWQADPHPWVCDSQTSSWRQSRCFRLGSTCVCHGPGGIRLHCDSQAAANILWCTISQFLGLDRPNYLSRSGPVVLHDDDL